MRIERWKTAYGFPALEVSSRGRVRVAKTRRVCIPKVSDQGYYRVRRLKVHLLVLNTFKGPKPSPELCCRHLDGNKLNNRISNLRWGIRKENYQDMILHGTSWVGRSHTQESKQRISVAKQNPSEATKAKLHKCAVERKRGSNGRWTI